MFNETCPDCGFDSDDRFEFVTHCRDRHLRTHVFDDEWAAYEVWIEEPAA